MMDFNFVNARVAVGAAVGDIGELVAAGVTHIVDCQLEFDDHTLLASAPGVSVLWIGVNDDGQPKPVDWFQKGVEFASDALSRPGARVYFHCAAGVNRGPSMCYAFMRSQGWDPTAAEAMIRAVRPQVGLAYKADADTAIAALGY